MIKVGKEFNFIKKDITNSLTTRFNPLQNIQRNHLKTKLLKKRKKRKAHVKNVPQKIYNLDSACFGKKCQHMQIQAEKLKNKMQMD